MYSLSILHTLIADIYKFDWFWIVLAKSLCASGPYAPLNIVGAGGFQLNDQRSQLMTLKVCGPNGVSHVVKCRTISKMSFPTQSVAVDEIEKLPHLRQCKLSEMKNAKPMLLLGQDNWELIVNYELQRGRAGEPVASLTSRAEDVHATIIRCYTKMRRAEANVGEG